MKRYYFGVLFSLLGIFARPAWSFSDIELTLQREKINTSAATHTDEWNLWILTRAFDVAPSVVEKMHDAGQDWGQACIRFALAKELSKINPTRYPHLTDALPEFNAIPFDHKNWPEQAGEKVDLAPVTQTVIDMFYEFDNPDPFPIGQQIFLPQKPQPKTSENSNFAPNTAPRQQPARK